MGPSRLAHAEQKHRCNARPCHTHAAVRCKCNAPPSRSTRRRRRRGATRPATRGRSRTSMRIPIRTHRRRTPTTPTTRARRHRRRREIKVLVDAARPVLQDREGVRGRVADVGRDVAVRDALLVRPGVDVVLGLPGPHVPADGGLALAVGGEGGVLGLEELAEPGAFRAVLAGVDGGVGRVAWVGGVSGRW